MGCHFFALMKEFSKSHQQHHSGVQTQSWKANIESGFLSYQAETAVIKDGGIPGESVVYLVGQPSWLDYGPQGLGVDTPAIKSSSQALSQSLSSLSKEGAS